MGKSSKPNETPQRPRSLEARIYSIYSTLSPAEKRLADILLQYQMDLPSYTAGELAAKAQVSKATAARLIRTLGYATYPDAKRQIRTTSIGDRLGRGLKIPIARHLEKYP